VRIATKNFSEQLTKAGIQNVYFESPGTAHEWLTWRRCLLDFAPPILQQLIDKANTLRNELAHERLGAQHGGPWRE
jgi:hypothetical protein